MFRFKNESTLWTAGLTVYVIIGEVYLHVFVGLKRIFMLFQFHIENLKEKLIRFVVLSTATICVLL